MTVYESRIIVLLALDCTQFLEIDAVLCALALIVKFLRFFRMSQTMNEKEELVKKSLFSFVRKQVPTAQLK